MNGGDHDSSPVNHAPGLFLHDGSEIAVIGGGPSGSLFTYFLLDIARRIGRDIHVDVYEEKDLPRSARWGATTAAGSSRNPSCRCCTQRVSSFPKEFYSGDSEKSYDLVVGAVGLKESSLRFFEEAGIGYHPPGTTKTYICEFNLGPDIINQY